MPQIDLGADKVLCDGETLILNELLPDSTIYVWNSLVADTNQIVIDSAGLYWLDAYNGCSYSSDTIKVEYLDVDLGNDTVLCAFESLKLSEDVQGVSYLWSTGETTQQITTNGNREDTIWLELDLEGRCAERDTIVVHDTLPENANLEKIDFGGKICVQDTLFAATSNWDNSYVWSTGDTTPYIVVNESGLYEVITYNECDIVHSKYEVEIEGLLDGLNDYNIFTPNEDRKNKLFTIYEGNPYSYYDRDYQLDIFNRWGRLIWSTQNPDEHWDGGNVSDGVYYYHLRFTNCANEAVERKGMVEVRR